MLPALLALLACNTPSELVSPASAAPNGGTTTTWNAPTGSTVRVDMLDVGQGDSILIRTPAKSVLIDASEDSADVKTKLRALGVQGLDLVVATHPHADHIGGMDDVVQAFPIKLYTDNGLPHTTVTYSRLMADIESKSIPYRAATAGTVYNLDLGAKLEVLFPTGSPLSGTRSDLNANSVVTRLTYKNDCFLFVGDSEEPTEQALLSRGLTPCNVLKVAHHGSEYSSTQPFLDAVRPSIAIISVGTGNTYGHPGANTLGRLSAMGAKIYRTDQMGTITLTTSGNGVSVTTGVVPGVAPAAPNPVVSGPAPSVPSPSGPAANGVAQPATACAYLSSTTSEVFHEAGCGQGERIPAEKRICYSTREAAVASGKRPAGCCQP